MDQYKKGEFLVAMLSTGVGHDHVERILFDMLSVGVDEGGEVRRGSPLEGRGGGQNML